MIDSETVTFKKQSGSRLDIPYLWLDEVTEAIPDTDTYSFNKELDVYLVDIDASHVLILDNIEVNANLLQAYKIVHSTTDPFGIGCQALPLAASPTTINIRTALSNVGYTGNLKQLSNIFVKLVELPPYFAKVSTLIDPIIPTPGTGLGSGQVQTNNVYACLKWNGEHPNPPAGGNVNSTFVLPEQVWTTLPFNSGFGSRNFDTAFDVDRNGAFYVKQPGVYMITGYWREDGYPVGTGHSRAITSLAVNEVYEELTRDICASGILGNNFTFLRYIQDFHLLDKLKSLEKRGRRLRFRELLAVET